MAMQAYRLTITLRLARSNADTTRLTVSIAAGSTDEAVDLAQFYRAGLPSEAVISVTLTGADEEVLWSEPADKLSVQQRHEVGH